MSKVFVVDTMERPLDPVHPGWARKLLSSGQAAIFRRYPFTIILKKEVVHPTVQPLRLKLDPGSKTTGLALVNDASGEVIFAAELTHRGQTIKKSLDDRRSIRRSRRQRRTRYRKPRFKNRRNKKKGWLPPSLESRISNVLTWVNRLCRYCPIAAISQELVKFDTQGMENPEISGVEYQQGTLAGYETREYLLEKWQRTCAYCGAKDMPLQVEHIQCRAKGGSNCVSNLTLACEKCNDKKGTQDIRDFLKHKPDVLKRILAQAKAPLKDAAAVNTTRWALYERLKELGLPIECGTGGRTKYNRVTRELEKAHWVDAACVGASTPEQLSVKGIVPLLIKALGSGHRQVCRTDRYGLPVRIGEDKRDLHVGATPPTMKTTVFRREVVQNDRLSGKERHKDARLIKHKMGANGKLVEREKRRIGKDERKTIAPREQKRIHGFQTGDIVRADIPKGRNAGIHVGRITAQASGTFYFGAGKDRINTNHRYCVPIHRSDGYSYTRGGECQIPTSSHSSAGWSLDASKRAVMP